ncbi:transposase InsO family protein [Rhodococcus sp. 27YEA15]|uniref:hypothetical protein n=1 Tax=Rhodococcus sp. 27YEA15 TaxID=3156259 RepID=UPI003C7A6B3E
MTYVATWFGFAYLAFATDVYSRRIVGWNVAATLKAEILPMQALDLAAWDADDDLTGLTHHSDHGSNLATIWRWSIPTGLSNSVRFHPQER